MKALRIAGKENLVLEDIAVPKVGNGEILCKMESCGICGTDIEKIRGGSVTNTILGHEVSGVVANVGPNVKGLKVGDRIFVHHHVSCGTCYYCRKRDDTLCEEFSRTNLDPCGFAEYFRVPETHVSRGAVIKLPQEVSYDQATFIEPLGCCIRGISKIGVEPGDRVAVLGAGAVGLLHLLFLKFVGVGHVIVSDIIDERLEFASKLGADYVVNPMKDDMLSLIPRVTEGIGVDAAIVATGNLKAFDQALGVVRKGGKILLFGAPFKGESVNIDMSEIFIREITIVPTYSTSERETNLAHNLIASGRLPVTTLVTHRLPFGSVLEALRIAGEERRAMKVLVYNQ